jgi:dephospho-CoA kinase
LNPLETKPSVEINMILGLTGSLGSGKSTVAEIIREVAGAFIIDADEITRRLQAPGGIAHKEIVEAFGPAILLPDGNLDRKKLADIAFGNEQELRKLNSIVHPLVLQEQKRLLEEHRNDSLVLLMVPLLYETGMEIMADKVLVVTVNENVREERLARRSGMNADEVSRRLKAQMDQAEKAQRADFVVDNSGTIEKTRSQVEAVLKELRISAKGNASIP